MKRLNPVRAIQRSPICDEIDVGIAFDCDNPAIAGTKDKAVAINYSHKEAATITRDGTNPQIITAFTLAGSDIGYVFEGQDNSHQPSAKYVKKTYGGNYDHIFKFLILNLTPAICANAEKVMKGRFVIVTEGYQKGAAEDSAFRIWGLDVGLRGIDLIQDPQNDENPGIEITLGSPEKIKEPHLPAWLFDTDYAGSKVLFDALYTP